MKTNKIFFKNSKILPVDKFVENEWKKQVNGKYGGPKPSNLSWRQFYNILEKEFEAFDELGKKVSWCVQNGHINLLQTLLIKENDIDFNAIKVNDKFLCCQRSQNKYSYLSRKFELPGGKVEDKFINKKTLEWFSKKKEH